MFWSSKNRKPVRRTIRRSRLGTIESLEDRVLLSVNSLIVGVPMLESAADLSAEIGRFADRSAEEDTADGSGDEASGGPLKGLDPPPADGATWGALSADSGSDDVSEEDDAPAAEESEPTAITRLQEVISRLDPEQLINRHVAEQLSQFLREASAATERGETVASTGSAEASEQNQDLSSDFVAEFSFEATEAVRAESVEKTAYRQFQEEHLVEAGYSPEEAAAMSNSQVQAALNDLADKALMGLAATKDQEKPTASAINEAAGAQVGGGDFRENDDGSVTIFDQDGNEWKTIPQGEEGDPPWKTAVKIQYGLAEWAFTIATTEMLLHAEKITPEGGHFQPNNDGSVSIFDADGNLVDRLPADFFGSLWEYHIAPVVEQFVQAAGQFFDAVIDFFTDLLGGNEAPAESAAADDSRPAGDRQPAPSSSSEEESDGGDDDGSDDDGDSEEPAEAVPAGDGEDEDTEGNGDAGDDGTPDPTQDPTNTRGQQEFLESPLGDEVRKQDERAIEMGVNGGLLPDSPSDHQAALDFYFSQLGREQQKQDERAAEAGGDGGVTDPPDTDWATREGLSDVIDLILLGGGLTDPVDGEEKPQRDGASDDPITGGTPILSSVSALSGSINRLESAALSLKDIEVVRL